MSTSTELLATYLMTPLTFTGEMQGYILALGLISIIVLTVLKVYYLFFHKSRLNHRHDRILY